MTKKQMLGEDIAAIDDEAYHEAGPIYNALRKELGRYEQLRQAPSCSFHYSNLRSLA
ncbi:hypothetical protein KIN20_002060 [Parelaphostrongylus tenuis]|uniref:Uncharacterized protein n=1 Tax=Parelaphostrongylus tenuis TaxID=148309 RepID=A0AAD5LV48_PARTN|nr:hypothetical protein KIN20_002060 [Parelaphostrongylus tenuis]